MIRGLTLFLIALTAYLTLSVPAQARYAAIVIDADTGQVLFSRNADTRNYPASLTKIMTLYMAFDALKSGKLRMDQQLPVSRRAAGMAPSKLGLRKGQTIAVKDVIMALVTKSANDAAVVMAEALGGKETTFARMMTKKARSLGMTRTSFRNASGLPNRGQLSTARDMATLAIAIMRDHPEYYHLFSAQSYTYKKRRYKNHNKLLASYEGTDGIKTGYTRASGFNLVASVKRNGRRLIGVVFGGKTGRSRDRHMKKILDKSFKRLGVTQVASLPNPPKRNPSRKSILVAASAPLPKPKPVAASQTASLQSADLPRGDWGIQVGAFSDYAPAESAAKQAQRQVLNLAGNGKVHVQEVPRTEGPLYRARIQGLDEVAARNACRHLKEQRMSCMAVPPSMN